VSLWNYSLTVLKMSYASFLELLKGYYFKKQYASVHFDRRLIWNKLNCEYVHVYISEIEFTFQTNPGYNLTTDFSKYSENLTFLSIYFYSRTVRQLSCKCVFNFQTFLTVPFYELFLKMVLQLLALHPRSSLQFKVFKYIILLLRYDNICTKNLDYFVKIHC
jgi:hypothetical protein